MSIVKVDEIGGHTLERVNKLLSEIPNGSIKAAHSALKRASDRAKTEAGRFAASHYTLTKGDFSRNVTMKTKTEVSGESVASVSVTFRGRVLPLLTFQTRYGGDGMVQTQVMRNGGASTLQHAFVENVFGNLAVFEREGKSRFPVRQLFGPSTAHMMENEEVSEDMHKVIEETFDQRIEYEILRVLNGWGG